MTKYEALKKALESNREHERHRTLAETHYWCDQYKLLAQQAIEALPQPAPIVSLECANCQLTIEQLNDKVMRLMAQPAQEPFGWYSAQEDDFMTDKIRKEHERLNSYTHIHGKFDLPLYTNPPQRPWVGLTDEDFQPAVQKAMMYYGYEPKHSTLTSGAGFYVLVRDIEAKLKEKNS